MSRPLPRSKSRFIAVAVTFSAVMVMLAPLRRGSPAEQVREAGWLPLLSAGGLADTAAFHRLAVSESRDQASDWPLLRPISIDPAP